MARAVYVLIDGKLVTKSIEGVTTAEYSRLSSKRKQDKPLGTYGSDVLPGGVNGILNHADGKRYDSKSQFERAVKAKGCRIVGNDLNNATWKPPIDRGIRGDFNAKKELREAVQRHMG